MLELLLFFGMFGKPINIFLGIVYLLTGGLFGVGIIIDFFLLPCWVQSMSD
jgi:hypothetical protein